MLNILDFFSIYTENFSDKKKWTNFGVYPAQNMTTDISKAQSPYPKKFLILSGLFLIINILQSIFTELAGDESYYWRYAQDLDWGYFDHPPLLAVMIKLGGFLFGGELGVRFVGVLFGWASIFLLWHSLDKELRTKPFATELFFLMWFAFPIFNIYTFITVPDSPLLFFAILYLYVLKKFKENSSFKITFVLAVVMALMLYSKYHGIILIFITIIADWKLLKNPKFYIAAVVGALLFIPHLVWQYNHDFATLRYHFFERNSEFSFAFIAEYPMNVLLILNPFLAVLFLFVIFKNRQNTDKTQRFVFWGFILFFAFSALKSHVEPHWIAISSVPLFVLLFKIAAENDKIRNLVRKFSIASIVILALGRFFLIFDILPIKTEFHGGKTLALQIEAKAGNLPVFLTNSYTAASKYFFYTGKPAFSYNSVHYRKNQFDFWNYEDTLKGKTVFFTSPYKSAFFTKEIKSDFYYEVIENFLPSKKIRLIPDTNFETLHIGQSENFTIELENPYPFSLQTTDKQLPLIIYVIFQKGKHTAAELPVTVSLPEKIEMFSTLKLNATFTVPEISPDKYTLFLSVKPGKLYSQFNSKSFKTKVEK